MESRRVFFVAQLTQWIFWEASLHHVGCLRINRQHQHVQVPQIKVCITLDYPPSQQ